LKERDGGRSGGDGPFLAIADQTARLWFFQHIERIVQAQYVSTTPLLCLPNMLMTYSSATVTLEGMVEVKMYSPPLMISLCT